MKLVVRNLALVPLLLLAGSFVAVQAGAGTLGYPSTEDASFLVDLPDGWEVEPGEEVGDFVHVNSDSGVYLAFRTIAGSARSMGVDVEGI